MAGALQERLAHLFVSLHVHGKKAIILCEGWDASGKGGAIQRLTAGATRAPTRSGRSPRRARRRRRTIISGASGGGCRRRARSAIFDRSWYGRVLVERVEGFANEAEWRRAYDEINELEAQLSYDGATIVKLFFHVTQEEQDERFEKRLDHPWKRWKVTAEDLRNRARRKDYLAAIKDMFDQTDTRWAPWTVIDGNNKKAARIAALTRVAEALAAACPAKPPPVSPEMERLAQALRKRED